MASFKLFLAIPLLYLPLLTTINSSNDIIMMSFRKRLIKLDDSDIIQRFNEWIEEQGIVKDGVDILEIRPSLRGIFTTKNLKAGDVISRIPVSAMIYEQMYTNDPIVLKARKSFRNLILLTIVLLQEQRNPNSRFRPYLDLFPEDLSNFPLFYGETEYKHLRGTNLLHIIEEHKRASKQGYSMVIDTIPELNDLSEEEYFKYYIYATSRSLRLDGMNNTQQLVMIPFFDMLNSSPYKDMKTENAVVKFSKPEQALLMYTNRQVELGEEILDYYRRDFTNTNYLVNYGFVFDMYDEITLRLEIPFKEKDPYIDMKKTALSNANEIIVQDKKIIVFLRNSTNDQTYWPLYAAARMRELGNHTLIEKAAETKKKFIEFFDNDTERNTIKYLISYLLELSDGYTTTIDQDNEILADSKQNRNIKNIAKVRRDEKVVIKKIISICNKAYF